MKLIQVVQKNPLETGLIFGVGFITGGIVNDKTHFIDNARNTISNLPIIKPLRVGLCLALADEETYKKWEALSNPRNKDKTPEEILHILTIKQTSTEVISGEEVKR